MPWEINPGWRQRQEFAEKLGYIFGAIEFMGETRLGVLMAAMALGVVIFYTYH